ncbi:ACP S-malonyltransferase [Paenibacillus yanchengensis]|uniref:Malonyl CoA-acyl carrier protein transacylase n=1 Tax=Paenibacillus yanchengensis TaxID=2035833 RepID=A0ABW4YMI9_9BACL
MSKIAFVFPGQGAQVVGMGKDAYDRHEAARAVFDEADRTLGFNLSEVIFSGPDQLLKQTSHTQPALLTVSTALLTVFAEKGIQPDFVAGHSLGEYSALVAAKSLRFADAVQLVRTRGLLMEEAVPAGQGAMAAVLGAERESLEQLCQQISLEGHVVELANLNCPGQIVISGSTSGVQAVIERGKEIGAKRVIPLEVSGPFHSSLMIPAAEKLAIDLAEVAISEAAVPVVANVTAHTVTEAEQIRTLLAKQVYSPVLWEDTIRYLIEQGVTTFIEIGSGSVISGLVKKIDRTVTIVTLNNMDAIEAFQL